MSASFDSFANELGYPNPVHARTVAEALGFKPTISLSTVMHDLGTPAAPQLVTQFASQGQFGWIDPSAQFDSPSRATVIRRASSFVLTVWAPGTPTFTQTFSTKPSGPASGDGAFFINGQGQWGYNWAGDASKHGIYTWQVTSQNSYGSATSKTTFGTNAPTLYFKANDNQTLVTVTGAGFEDPTCTVTASCTDYTPRTGTGNIVSGVTVAIQCQNLGQYWNIQAASADGSAPVPGVYHCSGGDAP